MFKSFKRVLVTIASVALAAVAALSFAACAGQDGKDGKDLSIRDIYAAFLEEMDEYYSFLEFLDYYFEGIAVEAQEAASLQSAINMSLLSSVAVVSQFNSGVGAGTGVIVDLDDEGCCAYIVTNAHVVYDTESTNGTYANRVYIYLYGSDVYGEDYTVSGGRVTNKNGIDSSCVEIIGASISYDLAVLKVSDSTLLKNNDVYAATFADEEECYVGEAVYTVGNALGYGLAAVTGVISRDSETVSIDMGTGGKHSYRVIRTDVAINSGNSGGGLFNSSGELVGIINSKRETSDDTVLEGMSAALPSSYARRIVQSMIDNYEDTNTAVTYVRGANSGLTVSASSTSLELNSESKAVITETVTVQSVENGSVSSNIFRQGDVITQISVGTMSGATSSYASTEESSSFVVETANNNTVARHYFTVGVTRSYIVDDVMFSVRKGDVVEIVFERNGSTMYAYLAFNSDNYFTTYD